MVEIKTKANFVSNHQKSSEKFRKEGTKDFEGVVWVELKIRGLFKNLYNGQMNFQSLSLNHVQELLLSNPALAATEYLIFCRNYIFCRN